MKTTDAKEVEVALLGACLLNRKAPLIASEYVGVSDFYLPRHQVIWDAIVGVVARGDDPDPVSVGAFLGNRIAEAGGSQYLHSLVTACPTAANVRQYAEAVQNAATDRRVRREIDQALSKLEGAELLSSLQETLYRLDRRVQRASTMAEVWDRIKERGTKPLAPGCEYPWQQIQFYTRGLRPGWFCVLAGEPSHGKTAAAIEITERALKHDKRVVYLSLEMGAEEIGLRLAQRDGLNTDNYYMGQLNEADVRLLGRLGCADYWKNLLLDRVERAAQVPLLIRRWKPDLLVVDHLQLLAGSEKVDELSRTTRVLKLTAERFDTPILCLSQLSRSSHEERNKKPRLSRLRGSGTIEQDADTVVFVWRERDENESLTSESALIVGKSRMGRLGQVRTHFNDERQSFIPVTNLYDDIEDL